jgi:GNAT superfamily N-acetyltransferase
MDTSLDYEVTSDLARLDVRAIHAFLATAYWSPGVPLDVVRRAVDNSVCFGVLCDGQQVAFARVVTDRATFGYLADVYVLEAHRGRGLGRALVESAVNGDPQLAPLRWMLHTRDMHPLYRKFGFVEPDDRFLERK